MVVLQLPLLRIFADMKQPKVVVGSSGLEPPTSRLSGVRSNRLSYEPPFWVFRCSPFITSIILAGGDERDRTADPLLARQVLSQLSYTPK